MKIIELFPKKMIELEDDEFKSQIAEKFQLSKDNQELGVEVKAILEHLAREKENNE